MSSGTSYNFRYVYVPKALHSCCCLTVFVDDIVTISSSGSVMLHSPKFLIRIIDNI